ncbi:hypothetical protein [Sinorhizobium glycinis]|uniref:hypothetical protein n=1 Tax=Sinorhizobium glycinis TaxID=1472378 RepID=UPI0012E7E1AA|nr:hypothetical protein [Sinorhizobium glycinis]
MTVENRLHSKIPSLFQGNRMDHPPLPHPAEDVAMLLKDIRHFNEYAGDFLVDHCSENLRARRPRTGHANAGTIRKTSDRLSRLTKICHCFGEEGDAVRCRRP